MVDNLNAGKRRLGRPPGSGVDDVATLTAIADLLVAEQGLRPTSAMKRTVKKVGASQLRRLQVKWKRDGGAMLAAAQQRQKERQAEQNNMRKMSVGTLSNHAALATTYGSSFQRAMAAASPLMMEQARMAGCLGSQNFMGNSALNHLISTATEQNKFFALASGLSPMLQTIGALAEPEWMKNIRKMTEQEERLRHLISPLSRFGL